MPPKNYRMTPEEMIREDRLVSMYCGVIDDLQEAVSIMAKGMLHSPSEVRTLAATAERLQDYLTELRQR